MALDNFTRLISNKDQKPNKFTVAIGRLIQAARKEAELSQAELAEKVYRRRATISDTETGKADVDATLLSLLAMVLDKPIIYFFPEFAVREIKREKLSIFEAELLRQYNFIDNEKMQKIAIKQITALADLFK